jgi:hypothetical protein
MSNPTSNFGWQMPTNTDLVTNLPADFEVFGQAVDSDFADLKGGTTGQILSKNSNTNLDFVWVDNQVGDITAITAGTGLSGGGTSGDVSLSIDSTVATLTGTQTLTNKTLTSPYVNLGYSAKTASYTTVLGDNGTLLSMNSSSATTFSIPTNASVAYPIGAQINFAWITGAGQPTISAVTPGTTTILSTGSTSTAPKLRAVNSAATAIKILTDTWLVVGDLA